MSAVAARLLEGSTGQRRSVCIEAADGALWLRSEQGVRELAVTEVDRAAPQGEAACLLYLPDGSRCEVDDPVGLDTVLAEARQQPGRLHFWSFRKFGWHCLVLALLVLGVAGTLLYRWSAPLVVRELAAAISPRLVRSASEAAMAQLDRDWLAPSRLDESRQNALRARFAELRPPVEQGVAWRVLFRAGGRSGPVSFSFPNGDIVITDELVALGRDDSEVLAVMAHEFAHLQRHDALHRLVRAAPLLALRADISSGIDAKRLASVFIDAPSDPSSRTAADAFARAMLSANQLDPAALDRIVARQQALISHKPDLPPLLRGE